MEESAKSHVCSSIYRQFPEVRGSNPSITTLPGDKFQLIFHGKVQTADGKTMDRTVRVATDEKGKILKLTTSR
jgi:hypothetical protein